MRFVHLTDPHLTSLRECRLSGLRGKRWFGYLSWHGKRRWQLRRDMLDRLTTAVRAENPAVVAITGDLVHIGLPEEIRAAREWLVELGPPGQVFLVPGNHDVYAQDSWRAITYNWRDYLRLDRTDGSDDGRDCYPVTLEREGVALVGVSSSLPTAPLLATGRLGRAQRLRLQETLAVLRRRERFACLLIHHPPVPGLAHWRKRLVDEGALEELLHVAQVPVALHGHMHCDQRAQRDETRIYGTAPASSVVTTAPASYRVFDIEPQTGGWQVTMTLKRHRAEMGDFVAVDREQWFARIPAPA